MNKFLVSYKILLYGSWYISSMVFSTDNDFPTTDELTTYFTDFKVRTAVRILAIHSVPTNYSNLIMIPTGTPLPAADADTHIAYLTQQDLTTFEYLHGAQYCSDNNITSLQLKYFLSIAVMEQLKNYGQSS